MKHVALLRDDRLLWDDVARFLDDVNAKVSSFGAAWTPEEVIGLSPDMIITSVSNLTRLKISLRRIPKVAIQADPQEASNLPASKLDWNLAVVEWPAGRDEFLQVTSRQLAISPRKSFACIFRLCPDGGGSAETAQTVNLSMTGLAFKSIADLEVGRCFSIALDLPGERDSLEARAKIVRAGEEEGDDPRITYGAEYLDPSHEFRRSMKRFIHTY